MDAIRARLRAGGAVTCEDLRAEANARVQRARRRGRRTSCIVSHGAQTAVGHEPGHGPIAEGEPVIVDLYPRDPDSGCYADMTRTFCVGEPPEELVRYHALVREALDLAYGAIRPGVAGAERPPRSSASSSTSTASPPSSRSSPARSWRRLLPQPRPRRRPRGARAAGPRPRRRGARRGRRARGRARPLPHGLRRLSAGGSRPRHRGRLRGPHGLSVRPRALGRRRSVPACQVLAAPSTLASGQ